MNNKTIRHQRRTSFSSPYITRARLLSISSPMYGFTSFGENLVEEQILSRNNQCQSRVPIQLFFLASPRLFLATPPAPQRPLLRLLYNGAPSIESNLWRRLMFLLLYPNLHFLRLRWSLKLWKYSIEISCILRCLMRVSSIITWLHSIN